MELYMFNGSGPCWRVALALEAKGLRYEKKVLNGLEKEHKSADYLKINPRGKVPALRDGDMVLTESLAILSYLDRKYPQVPLLGRTAEEAALIWRQLLDLQDHLYPKMYDMILPVYFGTAQQERARMEEGAKAVRPELERLDKHFAEHDWLAGEGLTAADFSLEPYLESLLFVLNVPDVPDVGLKNFTMEYPALGRYMERMRALPYFDRTYPAPWKAARDAVAATASV